MRESLTGIVPFSTRGSMQSILRFSTNALVFLFVIAVGSQAYNHPEIEWKTVATDHFLIHYYDKTECGVYATFKIAEEVYSSMERIYGFKPRAKINIALADYDDYSNGLAAWTQDNIMIWLPDARFDLRGNSTWLRNVLTHELAHLISLTKYGKQLFGWTFGFEYSGSHTDISVVSPLPLAVFYPAWFAEGTAQLEAERAGNDCWDSRRDMLLRCAVLDDRQLRLSEMAHFNHDGIGSEMVYNQGFSFVKHIEARLSTQRITGIWNAGRKGTLGGRAFGRLFEQYTGVDLQVMYDSWLDSLSAHYRTMVPDEASVPEVLWQSGKFNLAPRVSPDGLLWGVLSSAGDDFRRTDLLIFEQGNARPVVRIKHARLSWCFSSDGRSVYYVKAYRTNAEGSYFNDLFEYDLTTGTHRRVTQNGRVYDVAAAPDGTTLLTVVYDHGAFVLKRCNPTTGIFAKVGDGEIGTPYATPSIDPHGTTQAVVTRYQAGSTDLMVVDFATGATRPLCATGASEESPMWASDGRIYFSADYDRIFNIYSVSSDGSDLKRHSSAVGGYFSPHVGHDGTIYCSEYTSEGFRVVSLRNSGTPYAVEQTPRCQFEDIPRPKGKVRIKSYPYQPRGLRATSELVTRMAILDPSGVLEKNIYEYDSLGGGDVILGGILGLSRVTNDALSKRTMAFLIGGSVAGIVEGEGSGEALPGLPALTNLSESMLLERHSAAGPGAKRMRTQMDWFDHRTAGHSVASLQDGDTVVQEAPSVLNQYFVQFMLQSTSYRPLIEFSSQVTTLAMPFPLPGLFDVDALFEWQLGRIWWTGIIPGISFAPFTTEFSYSFPVYLLAGDNGYMNEDVHYNLGNVRWGQVYVVPGITPVRLLRNGVLEEIKHVHYFSAGLSGTAGFSIAKYCSIVEAFQYSGILLSWGNFIAGDIEQPSNVLHNATNRLSFFFPIVRNINAGGWYYFEDLYGEFFFMTSLSANDGLFNPFDFAYFSDPKADPENVAVSHRIGVGLEFGVSHSYLFSRSLSASADWDLWEQELSLRVSLGF